MQILVRSICQNSGVGYQFFAKTAQILLFALALGLIAKPSQAFDTGHHADVTRDVMLNQGLGNTAIEVVQLENWLVDYYSVSRTSDIKADVSKLHFDALFTTKNVSNYWGHLTVNTRNAVHSATRSKDPLKLLTIMGISLHAVQDFYSHSNWVKTHPTTSGAYRTETWFNRGINQGIPINFYTGYASSYQGTPPVDAQSHGGYDSGINKDAYAKPNWDQAYVFAYVGSREWISAIRRWVNEVDPTFWTMVKDFDVPNDPAPGTPGAPVPGTPGAPVPGTPGAPTPTNPSTSDRSRLNGDLEAMYRLSEWVKYESDNGHWKGQGSGSAGAFYAFGTTWLARSAGRFVSEFRDKKTYLLLSNGLTGDTPPTTPIPKIPKLNPNQRAIVLKTLYVSGEPNGGFFGIDPFNPADFYAKITIGGQIFTEAMQLDKSTITPNWTSIRFVPTSILEIPINYQLWDEDLPSNYDDQIDINPTGSRDLNFSFNVGSHNLSGDLTGVHDTVGNQVTVIGNNSVRGTLNFYVTERSLTPISEPVLQGQP